MLEHDRAVELELQILAGEREPVKESSPLENGLFGLTTGDCLCGDCHARRMAEIEEINESYFRAELED